MARTFEFFCEPTPSERCTEILTFKNLDICKHMRIGEKGFRNGPNARDPDCRVEHIKPYVEVSC